MSNNSIIQWEYLIVRFDYFAGDLRPSSMNHEDLRKKQNLPTLYEYMNELGEKGWEAVTLNYTPAHGYGFLVFKRPKITAN